MVDLTVVILTFNEELNIRQALENVIGWAGEVVILDSYSKDSTIFIAESMGAKIVYRKFDNYAKQRQYAIKEISLKSDWLLFLDADEYLTEELKVEIQETIENPKYDGYLIKRRLHFMGKWIRFGGYYPSWNLRLFRTDKASINREINEHVEVDGSVGKLKYDMIDENHKGLTEWIAKHNKYATMEAEQLFRKPEKDELAKFFGNSIERKRWIRYYIWNPIMPPLVRPFVYFLYRYVFRFGFLDGRIGFIFHFLQGLWFYFLIDVKYFDMKREQNYKTK